MGKISNLTHIFQMGWFNHQLGAILPLQVVGAAVMANVVQQTQSETQGVVKMGWLDGHGGIGGLSDLRGDGWF